MSKISNRLLVSAVTGLLLWGCSETDNLDQWTYESFPRVDVSGLEARARTPADLSANALAYQVALLYDAVLDPRGYDGIERPLDRDLPFGMYLQCGEVGRVWFDEGRPLDIWTPPPHLGDDFLLSLVDAWGCAYFDDEQSDIRVTATGSILFTETENDGVPADYTSFGASSSSPFRVQVMDLSSADETVITRAEVYGLQMSGPLEQLLPSAHMRVIEQRQSIRYANSIEVVAGDQDHHSVFLAYYGEPIPGGRAFVRHHPPESDHLNFAGPLASASTSGDEVCAAGWFEVSTIDAVLLDGQDLVEGELQLAAGRDADGQRLTARLVFAANGDVGITGSDGQSDTLSRADIQAVRETCIQKVPARY